MRGIIPLLYTAVFALVPPSTSGKAPKVTKEWMFHFDAQNQNNWDNYQITSQGADSLNGEASGCTARFPVIFKKLCVDWNHEDGFSLDLKSAHNLNIDQNYDDMLWFYGDHQTAKKAEKAAKTKVTADGGSRRRLITNDRAKCFWYSDARACARIDPSNQNAMAVSVGINGDNDGYFGAANEEFGEYYDDYDDDDDDYAEYDEDSYDDSEGFAAANEEYDDYEDYDYDEYEDENDEDYLDDEAYYNELYDDAMYAAYQQQALYNQQWANYMTNLNNLYWQNMLQQQQYLANAYGYGGEADNGFGEVESNVMKKAERAAQQKVEARLEKRLESKFEGKMEKDMMSHMGGGGGMVHRKGSYESRMGRGYHRDDADMHDEDAGEAHGGMGDAATNGQPMPPAGLIDM